MKLYIKLTIHVLFLFSCSFKPEFPINDGNDIFLNERGGIIDFANIKHGDMSKATFQALLKADNLLEEILYIDDTLRTFENTMIKLDDMYNEVSKVWNVIGLLGSVHPLESIRDECNENDIIIQDYMLDLSLNEALYEAVLEYASIDEAKQLPVHRKRFLDGEISDFKKSGLGLSMEGREELKKLHVRHSEISTKFYNNIFLLMVQ